MGDPVLEEFRQLNSLKSAHAPAERLRGGEADALTGEARFEREQFIDDEPEVRDPGGTMDEIRAEERERLLRRLELCAKAREESTRILSYRFAQRDAVKDQLLKERGEYLMEMHRSKRERDQKWNRKLQRSPFAVDLVAENQRIDEENRVRAQIQLRKERLAAHRQREAHNVIFRRAVSETDELEILRREKRILLENEKQLKAMRDVEKTNARAAAFVQKVRDERVTNQSARKNEATEASATR
mmetsp:Transcript_75384/g.172625  ORF Transcript_75384/g.172625 Transcript_75384/m.172625 type:complete len:243 (-) Transcript_75384:116-844(-)